MSSSTIPARRPPGSPSSPRQFCRVQTSSEDATFHHSNCHRSSSPLSKYSAFSISPITAKVSGARSPSLHWFCLPPPVLPQRHLSPCPTLPLINCIMKQCKEESVPPQQRQRALHAPKSGNCDNRETYQEITMLQEAGDFIHQVGDQHVGQAHMLPHQLCFPDNHTSGSRMLTFKQGRHS